MDNTNDNHGFSHEEIAYGAFCIFKEEERKKKHSGKDANWFMAIDRLKKIRARRAAPVGPRTCYMCEGAPTSVEHVPPRCFFPEQKDLPDGIDYRKGLITVPSCYAHNSDKSTDDAYLLAVIAAYYGNNQPSKDHYQAKILRALKKSTGFAHCVLTGSEKVILDGQETRAIRVDTSRFLRGLTHIARGLYFHIHGRRCPHPVQVHTPALHGEDKQQRQDVRGLIELVNPVFAAKPWHGENPAIFQFQSTQLGADTTVIKMLFFEGVEVLALSSPTLEE